MSEEVIGYHSEFNMGSPGGWEYQRMVKEIAKFSWQKIKKHSGIDLELDFDHPILNPVPAFAKMLLEAHQRKFGDRKPSIALVAERKTIPKVKENINFVQYLNTLPEVSALLISPDKLKIKNNQIYVGENKITLLYLDFNNDVIVKLTRKYGLRPLVEAIRQGMVINPRGIEPLGSKSIFEAIISEFKNLMSRTTIKRTPWTRLFFQRSTTGPEGEKITDLIKWTKDNWLNIVLKPIRGHSGKGIFFGYKEPNKEKCIRQALSGDYIVQSFIPKNLWAEEFPYVDQKNKRLLLRPWQTDFRCLIANQSSIGFVGRFGDIPTNVGLGGGAQSPAILRSKISIREAINEINEAILSLGFDFIYKLQDEMNKKSIQMGFVYVLGPIMTTLRPRIITLKQLSDLQLYAKNLWDDVKKLEVLLQEGKLAEYVKMSKEEEEFVRLAPWHGSPAIIASDGMFNFGGNL